MLDQRPLVTTTKDRHNNRVIGYFDLSFYPNCAGLIPQRGQDKTQSVNTSKLSFTIFCGSSTDITGELN